MDTTRDNCIVFFDTATGTDVKTKVYSCIFAIFLIFNINAMLINPTCMWVKLTFAFTVLEIVAEK